jgi:FkbM family methyltransferase
LYASLEALEQRVPSRVKRALLRSAAIRTVLRQLRPEPPYEPELRSALAALVRPGSLCVDVGAHHGLITVFLARLAGPNGHVVAFEAHPENARALQRTVEDEGVAEWVAIENRAVTDGAAPRVWLHPGRDHASAEWNIVGTNVEGRATNAELEVAATSLDSYFAAETELDLVKIDVEGAEAQVIAGMDRLLREARPALAIEFHGETGWGARTRLLDAGYDLYAVDGRRLDPVHDVERQYHCLALPSERRIDSRPRL